MKLNKKDIVKIFYIVILFILYNFLLEKFDYTIRYLTNFIFIIFIFVNFIFGQLDFYAERFRLKDVFIDFGINVIFSGIIFVFLKEFDIFAIFLLIFLFQITYRRLMCLKYVKKNNVLIFGSNHIVNNVQRDLINNLDYNYVGYISNNKSRATEYLLGTYDEMEKIIEEKKIDTLVIVKDIKNPKFKNYLKRLFELKINGLKVISYKEFNESIQKKNRY